MKQETDWQYTSCQYNSSSDNNRSNNDPSRTYISSSMSNFLRNSGGMSFERSLMGFSRSGESTMERSPPAYSAASDCAPGVSPKCNCVYGKVPEERTILHSILTGRGYEYGYVSSVHLAYKGPVLPIYMGTK